MNVFIEFALAQILSGYVKLLHEILGKILHKISYFFLIFNAEINRRWVFRAFSTLKPQLAVFIRYL